MKTLFMMAIAIVVMSASALALEKGQSDHPMMPPGMTGNYETVQAEVLKVFAADDNGARFRAYLVRWKDFEVIVSDPLGATDKKDGEMITFMAQRIEMPHGDKKIAMLQFMIMDFGAFTK